MVEAFLVGGARTPVGRLTTGPSVVLTLRRAWFGGADSLFEPIKELAVVV